MRDFTNRYGGRPFAFERNAPQAALAQCAPFAVIDVAGPFQEYGDDPYAFARASIVAGAHYIDITDAPEFVRGIKTPDLLAKLHNVTVTSGASSTPALSSAVVDVLGKDMATVQSIETIIVPGNRTPRGLSVMRAVLGQVGQPFHIWQDANWRRVTG